MIGVVIVALGMILIVNFIAIALYLTEKDK